MALSAGGGKGKQRRKSWYEIYWPDSVNSHANGTKGSMNYRRVASPRDGKKLYALLLECQSTYERTGFEHPLLKGTGAYVVERKKAKKQEST